LGIIGSFFLTHFIWIANLYVIRVIVERRDDKAFAATITVIFTGIHAPFYVIEDVIGGRGFLLCAAMRAEYDVVLRVDHFWKLVRQDCVSPWKPSPGWTNG
jgi:hypothetical protein